ncbi:hypothetical protein LTR66_005666, partial [Elasticomyces elasticus]
MEQHHQQTLSATFVPGGYDDYYEPPPPLELHAPAPQRMMSELPGQIQDGIANLELDSREVPQPPRHQSQQRSHDYNPVAAHTDAPSFSPFPKLQNAAPNVPVSDEELEATLENARVPVLNSNDPEMQLAWAQDTLTYVDIARNNEERLSTMQPARPATPQVEHQLRLDAMNIVSFLADQHHPKAEFLRGMWLEFGKFNVRQDKREAFRCYARAADRGYARAQYRIGMQYEQSNDPIRALRHYNLGVDANDSASCYRLGMMILRGQHGQPQDFAKGLDLIKRAAQTADENAPQGAYVYGMLLAHELPQIVLPDGYLPYDEKGARVNIEKAAYLRFAKAQLKMGSAYELGTLGCDFNPALSLHYNALAARQGEPEAEMNISKWFLVGHDNVFAKNEELAYIYAQRAAHFDLPTAKFAMGYFNELGIYVPQNLEKAVEWYEQAAKAGDVNALARLEGISQKRVLTKKDHENVAIKRIQSTYGSKRGGRPERFQQQHLPRLPGIEDRPAQYASYPNSPPGGAVQPPSRASNITP